MKKLNCIGLLFLILVFTNITFVSAQGADVFVQDAIQSTINAARNIFIPLFQALIGDYSTSQFFFAKILLLILLFAVIFTVLGRTPFFQNNRGVSLIVSAIVSLLGVRYISEDSIIAGILLPYGTLAIAITTFLPFLIYFWFVHDAVKGSFGRKIAWFLYGIIFIAVWYTRSKDIGGTSDMIYLFGFIALAISFIFDKTIHEYFGLAGDRKSRIESYDRVLARLESERNNLIYNNPAPSPEVERTIDSIENQIKRVRKKRNRV